MDPEFLVGYAWSQFADIDFKMDEQVSRSIILGCQVGHFEFGGEYLARCNREVKERYPFIRVAPLHALVGIL